MVISNVVECGNFLFFLGKKVDIKISCPHGITFVIYVYTQSKYIRAKLVNRNHFIIYPVCFCVSKMFLKKIEIFLCNSN